MITSPPIAIPPLENGDKLLRAEFERRYQAMPQIKKAELIEGIVYMASPLRIKSHAEPHAHIITWLGVYIASQPGIGLADNATVRLTENADGIICSEVFPGLCLDKSALLAGNLAKVLAVLQSTT